MPRAHLGQLCCLGLVAAPWTTLVSEQTEVAAFKEENY